MRRYARALILEGLETPQRLLEGKKYRRVDVFEEFLEEITKLLYTDGNRAFELARLGPIFARLVAEESGEGPNHLLVRAHNHLGSAYLVLGRFSEADQAYDQAASLPVSPIEQADTHRRRAYLRVCQGQVQDAISFADRAVKAYQASDALLVDRHLLGLALAARGHCYYYADQSGPAAVDASAAVALINLRTNPRTYYLALHNLTLYMLDVMPPDDLSQALRHLKASYRRFPKRHIAKFKLLWLEALACKRFGATRQAERLLKRAFNGFADMGAPTELATISLDIALFFIEEKRFDEARGLAESAFKIASRLGMSADVIAALKLWRDATVAEITPEFLLRVRSTIVRETTPFGLEAIQPTT